MKEISHGNSNMYHILFIINSSFIELKEGFIMRRIFNLNNDFFIKEIETTTSKVGTIILSIISLGCLYKVYTILEKWL